MARSEFGSKPSKSLGVFFAKPEFNQYILRPIYEQGPVEVLVVFELCNLLYLDTLVFCFYFMKDIVSVIQYQLALDYLEANDMTKQYLHGPKSINRPHYVMCHFPF